MPLWRPAIKHADTPHLKALNALLPQGFLRPRTGGSRHQCQPSTDEGHKQVGKRSQVSKPAVRQFCGMFYTASQRVPSRTETYLPTPIIPSLTVFTGFSLSLSLALPTSSLLFPGNASQTNCLQSSPPQGLLFRKI